jgi:hypothetical protein
MHPVMEYAGFWRRFLAGMIDCALGLPLYYFMILHPFYKDHPFALNIFYFALFSVFYTGCFLSPWHASPGMWIMRFQARSRDGNFPGAGRVIGWIIMTWVGWLLCGSGLCYISAHFDLNAVNDLQQSCAEQNLDAKDCDDQIADLLQMPYESFAAMYHAALIMGCVLAVIWMLSVALSSEKAGFHNAICGMRFVRGRLKR